jgi:DNA polymerase
MTIPMLAARDLAALLERPRWKADLWRAWLEWMDGARTG